MCNKFSGEHVEVFRHRKILGSFKSVFGRSYVKTNFKKEVRKMDDEKFIKCEEERTFLEELEKLAPLVKEYTGYIKDINQGKQLVRTEENCSIEDRYYEQIKKLLHAGLVWYHLNSAGNNIADMIIGEIVVKKKKPEEKEKAELIENMNEAYETLGNALGR